MWKCDILMDKNTAVKKLVVNYNFIEFHIWLIKIISETINMDHAIKETFAL